MKYYGMDPVLISIYNIRNIESIKIWDLVQNGTNRMLVVPAIIVMYDGGKQLNLCAKDKYFDIYVKKIVQVYNDEKENILEDSLTDPFKLRTNIDIDDYTKQILDSGILEKVNLIYDFYQEKESYDKSLMFQIDEVKSLINIVQYHIKRLFVNTDINVTFDSELSGFRDNYVMIGKIDGIDHYFPFTYQKLDNSYEFYVNGLINQNRSVRVNITFKNDEISVLVDINDYELSEVSKYLITNGVVKEIHDVTRKGITIGYKNNDLELLKENPLCNIANLDEETNLRWFVLPWGAIYGCDTKLEDVSNTEKIIQIQNMYLDIFDGGFIKKEYYSKNYKRNKTATINAEDMMLDSIMKSVLGINIDKDGKLFVIETTFAKEGTSSDYYNNSNCSRYFYHGCYVNNISDIERRKLIPLNRKQNVISNSDLVNKYRILKLVNGE